MTNKSCDYLVIGAGVIGLAIAREILLNNKNSKVLIVEKETEVGLHASGRNSGVLHAGFYYSPDSLKAKLTVDGNRLLREFCAENDVPIKNVGKVVVTKNAQEEESLKELYRRGIENGVTIEIVDKQQLKELERINLEHQLKLSQETALRAQMNPHFLFNTLNSISTHSSANFSNACQLPIEKLSLASSLIVMKWVLKTGLMDTKRSLNLNLVIIPKNIYQFFQVEL